MVALHYLIGLQVVERKNEQKKIGLNPTFFLYLLSNFIVRAAFS